MTTRYQPGNGPDHFLFVIPNDHVFSLRAPEDLKFPSCFGLDRKFDSAFVHNGQWVWSAETKSPKSLANFIDVATEYFKLTRDSGAVSAKVESLTREVLMLEKKVKDGPGKEKVAIDTGDVYQGQPVEKVRQIEHDGSEESTTAFASLLGQTDSNLDINTETYIGVKFSAYVMNPNGLQRIDVVQPKVE